MQATREHVSHRLIFNFRVQKKFCFTFPVDNCSSSNPEADIASTTDAPFYFTWSSSDHQPYFMSIFHTNMSLSCPDSVFNIYSSWDSWGLLLFFFFFFFLSFHFYLFSKSFLVLPFWWWETQNIFFPLLLDCYLNAKPVLFEIMTEYLAALFHYLLLM